MFPHYQSRSSQERNFSWSFTMSNLSEIGAELIGYLRSHVRDGEQLRRGKTLDAATPRASGADSRGGIPRAQKRAHLVRTQTLRETSYCSQDHGGNGWLVQVLTQVEPSQMCCLKKREWEWMNNIQVFA